MKLKTKFISIFIAVSIFSLTPVATLGYSYINRQVKDNINNELELTAEALNDRLNGWIKEKAKVVETIGIVIDNAADEQNLSIDYLKALKAESNSKDISDIYIGLESGRYIDGSGWIPDKDYDPRKRPWYEASKKEDKLYYSNPYLDKVTNKYAISIGYPLKNKEGKFIGAICEDILLSTITDTVSQINLDGNGYGFLVDKDGIILAHPDEKLLNTNYKDNVDLEKILSDVMSKDYGRKEYRINENNKIMVYRKIQTTGWILVVCVDKDKVYTDIYSLVNKYIIIIISTLSIVAVIAYLLGTKLTKPIVMFKKSLEEAKENNDLTLQFNTNTKDEISDMANAFNIFATSIRESFMNVIEEAKSVEDDVEAITKNIYKLNNNIEEVSATTEELAAGMEETAASSEEMSASSNEIERAVDDISEKAQKGSLIVDEINVRANELKVKAVQSQKTAETVRRSVDKKLRASLKQSNAVNEIQALTDGILQITSQTNLLALNAAIEAARAGEAGKGFAVVADEIRKLADTSKGTVVQIQSVVKTVIESVEGLKINSEEMLNFMETQVEGDYKKMVAIGEQYSVDAMMVSDLVNDFSATSQQLLASIQEIGKAVNEVAAAANQGAEGTTDIAQKSSEIVLMAEDVKAQAANSKKSSDELLNMIAKFKI